MAIITVGEVVLQDEMAFDDFILSFLSSVIGDFLTMRRRRNVEGPCLVLALASHRHHYPVFVFYVVVVMRPSQRRKGQEISKRGMASQEDKKDEKDK